MRSSVLSFVQTRKYHWTVPQWGKSCGRARHWQPVRATYSRALTNSLWSCLAGRPPGLGGGTKRSTWAHSGLVRSLQYSLRVSYQQPRTPSPYRLLGLPVTGREA
jgi:hypothetical protein